MKLYCDNKTAISTAHIPVQHDRAKKVGIDSHFLKEKVGTGTISMLFGPTSQQVIDILRKRSFKSNFEFLTSKMGIMDIYAPT